MNVKDFEYLAEIGRSESISNASKNLYISQPALSKFLQKMENEAGTPLFQHVGHRLVPTYAGEQCIKTAREILFLHNQLKNTLSDIAKQETGQIRFGLPMSRSSYFLARILPEFYRSYPHICVNIYEDSTRLLLKKLRAGELDLIFVNVIDSYDDLIYYPVSTEEMVLAAPECFGLMEKANMQEPYLFPCLASSQWAEFPFLGLSQDQMSRAFADQYFAKHQIRPNVVLTIRNLSQVLYSVQQGLGVTICPSMPLAQYPGLEHVQYFSLPSESGPVFRQTAVVYRKDSYLSVAAKILIQIISETYGKSEKI